MATRGPKPKARAIENLKINMEDATKLLELAERKSVLRKEKDVLRRSAIVLFTACWEAFVEDLAKFGFDFLIEHIKKVDDLPVVVKKNISDDLTKDLVDKKSKDTLVIWSIADDGWRDALKKHKNKSIDEIKRLNTPSGTNIDKIFFDVLGIRKITNNWKWKGANPKTSIKKLEKYISLRGDIAHHNRIGQTTKKVDVDDYFKFIFHLAVQLNNAVRNHLNNLTNKEPWSPYKL